MKTSSQNEIYKQTAYLVKQLALEDVAIVLKNVREIPDIKERR